MMDSFIDVLWTADSPFSPCTISTFTYGMNRSDIPLKQYINVDRLPVFHFSSPVHYLLEERTPRPRLLLNRCRGVGAPTISDGGVCKLNHASIGTEFVY